MVIEIINHYRASFWTESVWMPPNVTWSMYEDRGYRHFNDIYYSAYVAVVLLLLRFLFDRYLYCPLGIWMGMPATRPGPGPKPNPALEHAFGKCRGKPGVELLRELSKRTDLSERRIQRWMRLRLAQTRPTVLSKFTESAWRCTFYCALFIYGVVILWNKPWLWDSMYCFIDYPNHFVSNEEWWYYNIEFAFYLSLLFSQFFDIQRKDFWVMFVHHVVTLCLLTFSWACNLVRIGTLVLIIHDFADIPLEGAKMMAYAKKQRVADVTFNVFALCWVVSRIGLLPYRIIYYSTYLALGVVPMFPAYYIFNALLISLQSLHIIWTYFIIRVAIYAWHHNGIRDIRSDDEDEDELPVECDEPSSSSSSSSSDRKQSSQASSSDDDEEEEEEEEVNDDGDDGDNTKQDSILNADSKTRRRWQQQNGIIR